jgi:pilus assembly protein CpaC
VIELRTRGALACGLGALALVSGRATVQADAIQILSLQTGHSIILNADALSRVAVGDGRIAGVVPVGTSQIVVNGKAPGHTTIFIWSASGRTTYEVTVTEQSFDDIAKVLRAAIDEPSVQVVAFDVNLIVRGSVPDVAAFQRLQAVLDRFKGIKFSGSGSGGVIINAVSVAKPLGNLQDEISAIPGSHGLRIDADDKGNVVVSGSVRDEAQAQQVLDKVKGLAGPYLSADGKVVDRLGTDETSQVDVKVYVLEVDKTAQKNLGLTLQSAQPGTITPGVPGGTYTISSQSSFTAIDGTGGTNPFAFGPFARISLLAPTLNLLLTDGHAKILSAPNLVTQPGLEATFLVGGEIPIPVSNGLGTVSITYKEFGVKLDITPTILGNGGVETKIAPEVSQLDFADGISLNGFTVPAFKTSKLATDVITANGESIVMGGLLSRVESRNVTKFPILGDIPILGQLFRSTAYQHNDTDVVFVMTPTIVTK